VFFFPNCNNNPVTLVRQGCSFNTENINKSTVEKKRTLRDKWTTSLFYVIKTWRPRTGVIFPWQIFVFDMLGEKYSGHVRSCLEYCYQRSAYEYTSLRFYVTKNNYKNHAFSRGHIVGRYSYLLYLYLLLIFKPILVSATIRFSFWSNTASNDCGQIYWCEIV